MSETATQQVTMRNGYLLQGPELLFRIASAMSLDIIDGAERRDGCNCQVRNMPGSQLTTAEARAWVEVVQKKGNSYRSEVTGMICDPTRTERSRHSMLMNDPNNPSWYSIGFVHYSDLLRRQVQRIS
jgi:hypothetical protein